MRLPHVRFTARRPMVAVAICCLVVVARMVTDARDTSKIKKCEHILGHIAIALVQYETGQGCFPYAAVPNATLPASHRLSYQTTISAYIDSSELYNMFDLSLPWDGVANSRFAGIERKIAQCPAVWDRAPAGQTQWVGVTGVGPDSPWLPIGHPRAGVFGFDRQTCRSDIKDGAGTTLMVLETAERNGPWTAGGDPTVRPIDPARRPHIGPGRPFGGLHPGGVNAAFADGSVRFLRETIDPKVFEALSTVAGGEVLPAGWER